MVARIRTEGELVVIFSRDGDQDDARIVPNGERAAKVAILMIASRDARTAGLDLLACQDREPYINQTGNHSDAEAVGRQKRLRRAVAASLCRSILHA